MDQDEEEEDLAAAIEDEMDDDEDEDPNKKKPFGETLHFCPIKLKEKQVLWPGSPDCAVKYREKVYYLSTSEAREAFLENPELYLPHEKPFEVRSWQYLLECIWESYKEYSNKRCLKIILEIFLC